MNKEIELLHNKLEAQDKIINTQALEIARLKSKSEILEENNKLLIQQKQQMYEDLDMLSERIDKAIEYIKEYGLYEELTDYDEDNNLIIVGVSDEKTTKDLLEILGDKE